MRKTALATSSRLPFIITAFVEVEPLSTPNVGLAVLCRAASGSSRAAGLERFDKGLHARADLAGALRRRVRFDLEHRQRRLAAQALVVERIVVAELDRVTDEAVDPALVALDVFRAVRDIHHAHARCLAHELEA